MKRGCSLPFYHLIGLTYYLVLFRLFSDISKDTTVYIKNVAVDSVRRTQQDLSVLQDPTNDRQESWRR